MGGPRIVPFVPAHLADLDPPVFEPEQLRRFAAAYRPAGPAFTLIGEGRALGCGGLVVEEGEGRAWAFLSEALRQRPLLLHRTVKRALPALAAHYALKRITAEAHADFAGARRWLERLGFHQLETIPRFAGTTENYVRYVHVRS
ncbi:MAG: hypothetical protein Tsb0032_00390 [Kiloniellaceae bacterium]